MRTKVRCTLFRMPGSTPAPTMNCSSTRTPCHFLAMLKGTDGNTSTDFLLPRVAHRWRSVLPHWSGVTINEPRVQQMSAIGMLRNLAPCHEQQLGSHRCQEMFLDISNTVHPRDEHSPEIVGMHGAGNEIQTILSLQCDRSKCPA